MTSLKVNDHSLLARDFKAGQLPRGARGLKGGIYPWYQTNVEAASPDGVIWGDDAAAAEKWGFQVSITAAAAGSTALFANWAYTAP